MSKNLLIVWFPFKNHGNEQKWEFFCFKIFQFAQKCSQRRIFWCYFHVSNITFLRKKIFCRITILVISTKNALFFEKTLCLIHGKSIKKCVFEQFRASWEIWNRKFLIFILFEGKWNNEQLFTHLVVTFEKRGNFAESSEKDEKGIFFLFSRR